MFDYAPCNFGSHPVNESRPQILLQGRCAGRFAFGGDARFELFAVFGMLHPFALKFHGGARKNIGLVYRYGFQLVGLVEGTHTEYRTAVFAVGIADSLYNARETLRP